MMNEVIDKFRRAMLDSKIIPPDIIIADGKRHRFNHNERKGKESGFYKLYPDGIPSGYFGCWRTLPDIKKWSSKTRSEVTESEWQAHQKRIADIERECEEEAKAMHAAARKECVQLWEESKPCPDNHPYVIAKGIIPYGAHVEPYGYQNIIVPIYINGEIWSVQRINVGGYKRFHKGGDKKGGYMDIPAMIDPITPPETIVICEGWATGCSLHQATSYTVRVAFNAGSLMAVARFTRAQFPNARIILAADDDYRNTTNTGIDKANEAAKAVGGIPVVPQFHDLTNRPEKATDFNDLHQLAGIEEVLLQIDAQVDDAINTVAMDAVNTRDVAESGIESPKGWREELTAHVEKMNRNHAQVFMGGKYKILVEKTVSNVPVLEFYQDTEYRKMERDKRIQVGVRSDGSAVFKNPVDAWCINPESRKYRDGVVFKPCVTRQKGDGSQYNTWRGFAVEPESGDWEKIRYHIENMACKGDSTLSEYLLNWIAYTFQNPDKPAGAAIVLRGEKGTGKGLLGDFLMALWGAHGTQISNPKHLVGNFNGHLADICFLFADEAFFSGDKSHEGVLKALITERFMTVERKGIDAIKQPNYLKIFMATNSDWAVPASRDERRYFVSDMGARKDRAYYTELEAATKDKRVQSAFLHAMLTRDISNFHTGDIPESDALKDQRLHSLDSAGKWMVDSISAGGFEVKGERGEVFIEKWKEEIKAKTLFDSYKFWCDAQKVGEYGRLTQTKFGRRLNDWGFISKKQGGTVFRHVMTLEKAKEAVESVESITIG